jgi:hypothetical protein
MRDIESGPLPQERGRFTAPLPAPPLAGARPFDKYAYGACKIVPGFAFLLRVFPRGCRRFIPFLNRRAREGERACGTHVQLAKPTKCTDDLEMESQTPERAFHALVRQRIGALVAWVTCVPFHPAPVDLVAAGSHHGIKLLP